MPKLIKDGVIVDDQWQALGLDGELPAGELPAGALILPLQAWRERRAELVGREAQIGVWLSSEQLADELGEDARELPLIALHFPGFMDGRGFSTARLLRQRYGFEGELRAFGDIIRDQLFYLKRCGFDSFCLPSGNDLDAALASLQDFSESYQGAWDVRDPLFRRRA